MNIESKIKNLSVDKSDNKEYQIINTNRSNSAMPSNLKKQSTDTTKEAFHKIVTQTVNPRQTQREMKLKKQTSPSQRKIPSAHSLSLKYLLPNRETTKKTLVLDLDETLIHSNFEDFPKGADIKLNVKIDNVSYKIYAMKRPGVEEFLDRMSKLYEIVIYTASLQQYADKIIDIIDKNKNCKYRLFRENCTFSNGVYVKDLKRLNRDLKDVIIIDNSPLAFHFDVNNGLPISSFTTDKNDKELYKLDFILESLSQVNDIRQYIPLFVHGTEINFLKAKDIFLVEKRHLNSHPPILISKSFNTNEEDEDLIMKEFLIKEKNNEKAYEDYFSSTSKKENIDDVEVYDEKKHQKCKSIASIVVKPYTKEEKDNQINKNSKEDEDLRSKYNYLHIFSSTPSKIDKILSNTPLVTTINNSKINNLVNNSNTNSYSSIYKSEVTESNFPKTDSNRADNEIKKKSNFNTQIMIDKDNKLLNIKNQKINQSYFGTYSETNSFKKNEISKELKENKEKEKERKETKTFKGNNINKRDNSKSSLNSKYNIVSNKNSSSNIKINKISRNYKPETPSSTKSKGKSNSFKRDLSFKQILSSNSNRLTQTNSKIEKKSYSNKKSYREVSSSASKNKNISNLNSNTSKILGVKVFQIKSNSKSTNLTSTGDINKSTSFSKKKKDLGRSNYHSTNTNKNLFYSILSGNGMKSKKSYSRESSIKTEKEKESNSSTIVSPNSICLGNGSISRIRIIDKRRKIDGKEGNILNKSIEKKNKYEKEQLINGTYSKLLNKERTFYKGK